MGIQSVPVSSIDSKTLIKLTGTTCIYLAKDHISKKKKTNSPLRGFDIDIYNLL